MRIDQPAPRVVRIVAGVLALLGVAHILRILVTVALSLADRDSGARAAFLVLNAVTFAVAVLYLVLALQLSRGHRWAWITTIVLLALTALLGALMLLGELAAGALPVVGSALLVPTLALLFALTVPGSARAYFTAARSVDAYPAVPRTR